MQPVSFDVFQRREQQGKVKVEARRGDFGGTAEGGREVHPRERASHQTPLTFATKDRPYPTPPSSSSPPATALLGSPSKETSRGRGPFGPAVATSSSSPGGVEARKRPTLRPRTQTPPSWPSTAETVPSQLVGGRAGPNAGGLRLARHHDQHRDSDYSSGDSGVPSTLRGISPMRSDHATRYEEKYVSAVTTTDAEPTHSAVDYQDQGESPATSTESGSSKSSYASSFAHLVSDRRNDTRLLHKRSKPTQHLQKRPSPPRSSRPNATRSPSYYKPRIVEDTLTPLPNVQHMFSPAAPFSSSSEVSDPSTDSQQSVYLRRTHSPPAASPKAPSNSLKKQDLPARRVRSHSPIASPPSHQEATLDRQRQGSGGTEALAKPSPTRRGLRIELPSPFYRSQFSDERSHSRPPLSSRIAEHPLTTDEAFGGIEGPFTPLEISTASPRIAHGNHYFRTFGEDTMYDKTTPVKSPDTLSTETAQDAVPKLPQSRPQLQTTPSERTTVHDTSRKRRSLLLTLKNLPLTESTLTIHNNLPGSPSPKSYDPTKSFLALSRHTRTSNRSDNSGSSYFGLGRRQQNSSDLPNVTPHMPTHQEMDADGGLIHHGRDHSSPLSPSSAKRPRLKWSHQVLLEHSKEKADSPKASNSHESLAPAASTTAPGFPQKNYLSADGKEYPATSLTGPGAPNFLPSEMKRVDTPPLKEASPGKQRLRAFKSFFFDSRSLPKDEDHSMEPAPRESTAHFKRYRPVLPKASLQSLANKLSLPRLREKPLQALSERRESDPLAVTGFEQTPFSQRYGDARRAKQMQMRACVWDETLREDDDSSPSSLGHAFELNIPDHLTNSPLCPLNEKHKCGGKAICPIHGRKKMTVNAYPGRARTAGRREGSKSARREPTIVFESGKAGKGTTGASGNDDVSELNG